MASPLEIFDQASLSVTQERGKIYGHPADDFKKVALMAMQIEECTDLLVRHALYMILVKIARLVQSPGHIDSVVDIAGYARTIAMIQDKRAQDEQPVPPPTEATWKYHPAVSSMTGLGSPGGGYYARD